MRACLCLAVASMSILSACRKSDKTTVAKVVTTADSADQVMYKPRTVLTDRGVLRAELTADTSYVFDENTRYELRIVSTVFFNRQGEKDGTLTSKRGTYNLRANVMEARENVVITSTDGKRLSSPMVRFEQFRNMIVSDSPFVLIDGERRLEGIGFESDPQMLNVKVRQLSRATGASIVLPAAKGSAPIFRSEIPQTSGLTSDSATAAKRAAAPSAGRPRTPRQ